MHTDQAGNKYYSVEEAMQALGIKRSTFQKLVTDEKVPKYRRSRDKKHYYRVEDIEALKNRPDEFHRVDEEDRAALAVAC